MSDSGTGPRTCSSCGAAGDPEDLFCSSCGAQAQGRAGSPPAPPAVASDFPAPPTEINAHLAPATPPPPAGPDERPLIKRPALLATAAVVLVVAVAGGLYL